MITTVTLNPALDRFLYVDRFNVDSVNKVVKTLQLPGGKGINASIVLKALGAKNICFGIAGGNNGRILIEGLKKAGLHSKFIFIDSETRINIKIFDASSLTTTEFNELGPELCNKNIEDIKTYVRKHSRKSRVIVFSGSLPQGCPVALYRDLVITARKNNCITILDSSFEALCSGIEAKPFLIKPNIKELEFLSGKKFESDNSIISFCKSIVNEGTDNILLSMGEKGSLLINKVGVYSSKLPDVTASVTTGAGDSMVAAAAFILNTGGSTLEAYSLACAAATACISSGGIHNIDKQTVMKYLKEISIYKLE